MNLPPLLWDYLCTKCRATWSSPDEAKLPECACGYAAYKQRATRYTADQVRQAQEDAVALYKQEQAQ